MPNTNPLISSVCKKMYKYLISCKLLLFFQLNVLSFSGHSMVKK